MELKRSAAWPLAMALSVLLTGCGAMQGYPTDPEDTDAVLSGLQTDYFAVHAADAYNAATDPVIRKQKRDDIVVNRIRAYDIEFSRAERTFYETGNSISTGGDFLALVLNGLGATTGDVATKAALAAAAGGVVGAQGAVGKDLYYQRTLPALLAQMSTNRNNVKTNIFKSLLLSDVDYPLARAEDDLFSLNDAGSIWQAVNGLTTQASTAATAAQSRLDAVRTVKYVDTASTARLVKWLYINGAAGPDPTNLSKLTNWMGGDTADTALPSMPWFQFLHGDEPGLEADRARAITALNVP